MTLPSEVASSEVVDAGDILSPVNAGNIGNVQPKNGSVPFGMGDSGA